MNEFSKDRPTSEQLVELLDQEYDITICADVVHGLDYEYKSLQKENQKLKRQLEYLRSGEYLNQLKFERDMLQYIIDNGEVSKEDKTYIDCTHRNTKLLAQQKEFIEYLENEKNRLAKECSHTYEDSLGKLLYVNEDIFNEVNKILSKYKEIIGDKYE